MSRSFLTLVILSLVLFALLLVVVEVNLSLGTLTAHHAWTQFLEAWCRLHCTGQ